MAKNSNLSISRSKIWLKHICQPMNFNICKNPADTTRGERGLLPLNLTEIVNIGSHYCLALHREHLIVWVVSHSDVPETITQYGFASTRSMKITLNSDWDFREGPSMAEWRLITQSFKEMCTITHKFSEMTAIHNLKNKLKSETRRSIKMLAHTS